MATNPEAELLRELDDLNKTLREWVERTRRRVERLEARAGIAPPRPELRLVERFAGCTPCECGGHPDCLRCNPADSQYSS